MEALSLAKPKNLAAFGGRSQAAGKGRWREEELPEKAERNPRSQSVRTPNGKLDILDWVNPHRPTIDEI